VNVTGRRMQHLPGATARWRHQIGERQRGQSESAPSASAAASTASAFRTMCLPGLPSAGHRLAGIVLGVEYSGLQFATARASERRGRACSPKPQMTMPASRAASVELASKGRWSSRVDDRGAALADALKDRRLRVAIPSRTRRRPRCTAAIVVIIAMCGRTIFASGEISPACVHADLEHRRSGTSPAGRA
jgi:hypothetical protein